jgi:antitoxin component YwqK of YwqJK toxin-antitoxin module
MGFLDKISNMFKKEEKEKINQYNKAGEKEGRWQEEIEGVKTSGNYVNGSKEGKWTTINKDNSILEENYVNGFVEGISKEFYPPTLEKDSFGNSQLLPGEIKTEVNHENGVIKEYYENGKLKLEGIKFEDSIPDYDDVTTTYNHFTKDFKKYYENGNLEFECDSNHIKEYYENGNLKYSAFPDKNCQNALAEENYYYENGNLKQEVKYQISEFTEKETYSNYYESFVSQIKDYNKEGNLEKERSIVYEDTDNKSLEVSHIIDKNYENNNLVKIEILDKDGKVIKEKDGKDNDRNHSGEKVVENYDNGQLKSSKEYDENGNIKSHKIYTEKGELESATSRYYFENGALRIEETEKITDTGSIITSEYYEEDGMCSSKKIEYKNKEGEVEQRKFLSYRGIENLRYITDEKFEKEGRISKSFSKTKRFYFSGKIKSEEMSKRTDTEAFDSTKHYREDGKLIYDYEKVTGNGKMNTILNFYDKEGNSVGETKYDRENHILGVGKYNENGEKEGFWCEGRFDTTGFNNYIEIKDVEDLFTQSGNYVNGEKDGIWKSYDTYHTEFFIPEEEQFLYRKEAEYKDGKLNGKVSVFSIDGYGEEKKLLDMEYKENSLVNYKCHDDVPDHAKLPNVHYHSYLSTYDKTVNFNNGEYAHKITMEENGNTIIENYKKNLLESKYIIDIEGNTKNSIEYSKDGKIIKEIDNQENKVGKESSNGKKNPWAKTRSRSRENENER